MLLNLPWLVLGDYLGDVFGVWFGMANRLLVRPLSMLGLIGQTSPIAAVWRHLHIYPARYAVLSNRCSGRQVLSCG